MTNSRLVWWVFFVALSLFALLTPIFDSRFGRQAFSCDFGGTDDWAASLLNKKHLVFYSAVSLCGFMALQGRSLWKIALALVLITAGVELMQALFASGHCRVRDMLPNVAAIGIGFVLSQAWQRLRA